MTMKFKSVSKYLLANLDFFLFPFSRSSVPTGVRKFSQVSYKEKTTAQVWFGDAGVRIFCKQLYLPVSL